MCTLLHRLDTLRELAKRFRAALETCDRTKLPVGLQAFPSGACGDASLLLAKYFEENEEGKPQYVSGKDGIQTHTWLELDGIIIDITADQFHGVNEPVVVTTDSTWHHRFEEQSRRSVSIEDYDARTSASLNVAYREILHSSEKAQ
jgi:hypothetical protein